MMQWQGSTGSASEPSIAERTAQQWVVCARLIVTS